MKHEDNFMVAEWYGNSAYLYFGNTYIQCIDNPNWRELNARGYIIIFK